MVANQTRLIFLSMSRGKFLFAYDVQSNRFRVNQDITQRRLKSLEGRGDAGLNETS
jgi:hypothetical protein